MNMKRLLTLVAFFATLQASAQQVNPVPDYVFANRMSAGRNTVTDTAAYFSIGPRYGATRGMMPPMVVDTASFSGNKRNGLLIFSVQKNKFLYWDSVGVKWAEMAGTGGTAISSGDTAAMLSPYVRHAGYGLTKSGQSFLVDTLNIATRAWRQKGLDSLAALEVSGSGTTNYVPKFTAGSTIGNSIAFDNGGEFLINTTTDAGNYKLQVSGDSKFGGIDITSIDLNTSGQRYRFTTRYGSNSDGKNIWIGDGGNSSIGQSGQTFRGSQNTSVGVNSMYSATTAYDNSAIGVSSLQFLTVGYNNMAMGGFALRNLSSGYSNIGIGYQSAVNLTIGYQNIAVGQDALRFTNSGTSVDSVYNSIFIGNDSRPFAKTDNNEIVIGYQARGNGSNTVTIGNSSITQNYFSGAINTSAPSGGSIKPWKIGEAATVSPTSPNRTIRVEIDGVVYYLHAKTTND